MKKFIENVEACINEPDEINLDDVKMSINGAEIELRNIEFALIESKRQIEHLTRVIRIYNKDAEINNKIVLGLIETTIKHLKG